MKIFAWLKWMMWDFDPYEDIRPSGGVYKMRNHKIDTSKLGLLPIPAGYKLYLSHAHPNELKRIAKSGHPPPRYATIAILYDKEGNEVAHGSSFCSHKDVPNRKLGNIIAHNRCIKSFNRQNKG